MTDAADKRPLGLDTLRANAVRLVGQERTEANSGHLLAALLAGGGVAAELLERAGARRESALTLAASAVPDEPPFASVFERAAAIARSMRCAVATEVHVLLALMNAKRCRAHLALVHDRVDLPRLRVLSMNEALGLCATRQTGLARRAESQKTGRREAVTVPLSPRIVAPRIEPRVPRSNGRTVPSALSAAPPSKRRTGHRGSRFALDPKRHKLLRAIGHNLTLAAANGELPEVVGREAQVDALLDVLAKQRGNSPCLVGRSGVGKTSVVHALCQRIATARDLPPADDRIVVEIPLSGLLQRTGVRGSLAQRIVELEQEVQTAGGRIVLFFDDVHQLFGPEVSDELSNELRRALASGRLPCIGATTPQPFAQTIEADSTLQRRFTRVEVNEPSAEVAAEILELAARHFGELHGVDYDAEALAAAIAWSVRYLPGRALPDKALSIIDLAGAQSRRRAEAKVDKGRIADIVSELASVPRERLMETDAARLLRLEATIAERVVGHGDAMSAICRIVRRNAAGLEGARPIGTFLLLGPTGVGKTETAKAVAEVLFGTEHAMTRLDLSEYSESHSVARLFGAPPGYVGFEAGGQLTEAVRRRPYQVILLDEVEKAHPEVLAAFLPVFDEGHLTDGQGRRIDFTHTVIFLTSNLGAKEAAPVSRRLGFGVTPGADTGVEERVRLAAKRALSPEFWNRLDETLVFGSLSRAEVEGIARRLLQRLADRVHAQREIELSIENNVVQMLLERGGYDSSLGARPMRRAIARWVEAPLAEALLRGDLPAGARVRMSARQGQLVLTPDDSTRLLAAVSA